MTFEEIKAKHDNYAPVRHRPIVNKPELSPNLQPNYRAVRDLLTNAKKDELLRILTHTQIERATAYFVDCKTYTQISKDVGATRGAVASAIKCAVDKITRHIRTRKRETL